MAKKKHPPVSEEEARRGIYIDFEGTVKDPASFLGILLVDDGDVAEFDQPVFEEALWPVARHHRPGKKHGYAPREADFKQTCDALRERADSESRKLFAYSQHEIDVISERIHCDSEVQWWQDNLINALPYAKAWKKRHYSEVEFKKDKKKPLSGKHTLDQFLKLIGYEVPALLRSGNSAQRIKYVKTMLIKHGGNYEALTAVAKRKWTNACRHNFHDCAGLGELMIRCTRDIP